MFQRREALTDPAVAGGNPARGLVQGVRDRGRRTLVAASQHGSTRVGAWLCCRDRNQGQCAGNDELVAGTESAVCIAHGGLDRWRLRSSPRTAGSTTASLARQDRSGRADHPAPRWQRRFRLDLVRAQFGVRSEGGSSRRGAHSAATASSTPIGGAGSASRRKYAMVCQALPSARRPAPIRAMCARVMSGQR